MSPLSRPLQRLIDREKAELRPSSEAFRTGLGKLRESIEAGKTPAIDVVVPRSARRGRVAAAAPARMAVVALAMGLVGIGAYVAWTNVRRTHAEVVSPSPARSALERELGNDAQ